MLNTSKERLNTHIIESAKILGDHAREKVNEFHEDFMEDILNKESEGEQILSQPPSNQSSKQKKK